MFFDKIKKEINKRKHLDQNFSDLEILLEKNLQDLKEFKEVKILLDKSKLIKEKLFENKSFVKLFENLKKGNFWVVGGFTRDVLAEFQPKDIDLVTDLDIKEVKDLVKNFKIKEVGKHFGVLLVDVDGVDFEIATFRSDKDNSGFKKGDIYTDFERRDFDVNAIYFNLQSFLLEDKIDNGGIENAINRRFKFQGNCKERIKEDPLRVLRAFKLIKKGFKPCCKKVMNCVRNNFEYMLKNTNPERIRTEFEKIIEIV
jgi:tRNA nucleotidyltransferase (CCA-adding enzyme)